MEYIFLSGDVGYEITPTILNDKIDALETKEVTIYLNTVGGFAFDGIAMYDLLKLKQSQGFKINTVGSGVTASAGTLPFLAGNKDTRQIHNTTTFLCHEASNFGGGQASDFEKNARELKALNNKIAEIYEAETDLTKDEALILMALDESSTAEYLIGKGFANEIIKYESVASLRQIYNNKNNNDNSMTKEDKGWFADMFAKWTGKPTNKLVQDAEGVEIDFYDLEDDATPKVGDMAKVEGADAEGTYTLPNETVYVFVGGALESATIVEEEVEESEEDVEEEDDLAKAKQEIEELKEQLQASATLNETATASLTAKETEFTALTKDLKDVQAKITSSGVWNGIEKPKSEPSASRSFKGKE